VRVNRQHRYVQDRGVVGVGVPDVDGDQLMAF
jgi:hypothetical protein